jgi:hypothetical protein
MSPHPAPPPWNAECTPRLSQDGNRTICTAANGFNGSCSVLLVSSGSCGERAGSPPGERAWVIPAPRMARHLCGDLCCSICDAAQAAPVGLLPAGLLDDVATSHRANGMNPVRIIELYRNKGSRNIDAIQLFYQGKVRWEGTLCRLPAGSSPYAVLLPCSSAASACQHTVPAYYAYLSDAPAPPAAGDRQHRQRRGPSQRHTRGQADICWW